MTQHNIEPTHGFTVEAKDGDVIRNISIVLLSDGSYGITLKTIWTANAEPFVTQIRLTKVAFEMLEQACFAATHEMHRHKIAREPTDWSAA